MAKKHDYDAAWKTILEAFEEEIVELLFPELYNKINWQIKSEALDNELLEIQKDIFNKEEAEKIISDKIIKVTMKDNESKILFIHVEVQSYSSNENVFAERMFRYFYRIWDKFRYKYKDSSDIVGSAIYTYKGSSGKDKRYVYKLSDLEDNILIYNFRTMDVENLDLNNISDENPLKLVFKIAKKLLDIGANDNEIFLAKVELFNELINYNKVKTTDQRKALTYFLEYLFLIQDDSLLKKFKDIKENTGGVINMGIDEIREKYLKEEGEKKKAIEIAKSLLDV
ncbi:MAG: Rpn family recombination-promoting nuclease/putative transposase, partial [Peptostreptococcaceae bacterium]